jgi:Flp pilus assembly protein TadG
MPLRSANRRESVATTALRSRASFPQKVLRRLAGDRGTAIVEFALVVLPLSLIVFGIIDFSRALNYYNDLTQLAGQGARVAAQNVNPDGTGPPGATSIQSQLASNYPSSTELGSGLTVCISKVPTSIGQPVEIHTSYTFHFIPLVSRVTLTLEATQDERAEVVPDPTTGYKAQDQLGHTCS